MDNGLTRADIIASGEYGEAPLRVYDIVDSDGNRLSTEEMSMLLYLFVRHTAKGWELGDDMAGHLSMSQRETARTLASLRRHGYVDPATLTPTLAPLDAYTSKTL